ncbi:Hypothetical protein CINCED_3A000798 [Cinara cedri]|uniref:Uncharacterized protein n=1 Tax=Cinara cedri TaxID=506608 RepID=A0A5E4NCI2_9HEMI|nr:Hypothetical protein CINCED_3A000798 [Cinara cedri]
MLSLLKLTVRIHCGRLCGHQCNGQKKKKFKGLYSTDGKIGCDICRKMGKLKTPQKIQISQEWATCEIDGGTNTNKKTHLTVLRNKLKKHFESNSHKSAVQILDNKDKNMLSKFMEEKDYQINKATYSIFRTAYYIAKYNCPFDDHLKLVQLQELNGIKLGFTLHSRHSSTNILQHISEEMKHKIIKNIIDTNAKCSILIHKSTTLNLVELKNQTAENIVNQLINCLYTSGLDENYLQQHCVSFEATEQTFCWVKNGVAKKLKDKVITSFKTNNGDYMHQAVVAIKDMKFKNIDLTSNKKMISINKNQFLTSIENNLKSRLLDNDSENKIILKNILVLEKSTWPEDPDIRYGEDDIKYLCKRFSLDQDEAISSMRKIIYDQTIDPKNVMFAFYIFLKTFPCSTAEYERGFSVMNNICMDLCSRLTIINISNLMFIKTSPK